MLLTARHVAQGVQVGLLSSRKRPPTLPTLDPGPFWMSSLQPLRNSPTSGCPFPPTHPPDRITQESGFSSTEKGVCLLLPENPGSPVVFADRPYASSVWPQVTWAPGSLHRGRPMMAALG